MLVGTVQKKGKVPQLGIAEGMTVRGHAGASNTKGRRPEEFPGGFGGSDPAVAAKELLGVRKHLPAYR